MIFSVLRFLLIIGSVAVVLWWGRRIPLVGPRKAFVTGSRIAVVLFLCTALLGASSRRTHEVPRHVVYLVDRSLSMEASQRHWIARRIASLEAARPARMERAVVAFGAEPKLVVPFGEERLLDPEMIEQMMDGAAVAPQETNLEAALLSALPLLTGERQGSVILFSDGRETEGSVTGLLRNLHRLGLEVFPVAVPASSELKTAWDTLVVPPVVQRGSPVPVQLMTFNGTSRPKQGEVSIALQGVEIKRQRVTVQPGWQVLTLSVPALGRGTMALDVRLTVPSDGFSEQYRAYTEVEGPPQLLVVTDRTGALPAVATALKRREIEIAVAHPADLPTDPSRLLDYDGILLFNIPKSVLSVAQVDTLRSYVAELGGGLMTIGLGGDLSYEVQNPSPLDALLPVRFEPKGLQEARRRVCVILLIDRSASMLGPRIAATKHAAVALIKQLAPEDLVGVLAFDTQPYIVVEVQPAGQIGPWLVDKLVKLRSTGGTDIYPALIAATDRLDLTGATLKHIILLSDGNTPFQEQAYETLVRSMKTGGTTVSTIGIGSAFVNVEYLQWLARSTGGTFYQMRNVDELPGLVVRDTERALGHLPFAEGYFRPVKSPATDWFAETVDWPLLKGYFTATAKPESRVDLTINGGGGNLSALPTAAYLSPSGDGRQARQQAGVSDETGQAGDPLLARWTFGQGHVVSFTSDADSRWAPEWIRWPGFEGTWAQVVRWMMRPRLTEELFVRVDESQATPQLSLEGTLREPRAELTSAEVRFNIPLSLVQTGNWRWYASLEQVPSGWYQLTVESGLPDASVALRGESSPIGEAQPGPSRADGGSTATDTTQSDRTIQNSTRLYMKRWVRIGTPTVTRETPGQSPRESVLRHIARATDGFYDMPDRALLPATIKTVTREPLLIWWLPLCILMLLIDVALRGNSML